MCTTVPGCQTRLDDTGIMRPDLDAASGCDIHKVVGEMGAVFTANTSSSCNLHTRKTKCNVDCLV